MEKDFLDYFSSNNSKLEFTSISNWNISVLEKNKARLNKSDNVYFLWWVNNNLSYSNWNRAKDDDIVEKNYFVIDVDLFNIFEKYFWEKLSYEEIEKEWNNIITNLAIEDPLLWEFSFINISWCWLHIYYMWEFTQFKKEEYKIWVQEIYSKWNKFWWDEYKCDGACCNIWRIIRLPWSINQKNWKECKILFWEYKKSRLFENIKKYSENKLKIIENERIQKEKEFIKKSISHNEFCLYKKINEIPAFIIAEKILPQFKFSKNQKNFDNQKNWYCAYYYVKNTNTICNGWSRHFLFTWDEHSCWNNFSIIKNFYSFTNKETFSYFKTLLK